MSLFNRQTQILGLKRKNPISKDYEETSTAPSVRMALGTFQRRTLVQCTIELQAPTVQRINFLEFSMGSMCMRDIFRQWVQKDAQAKVLCDS